MSTSASHPPRRAARGHGRMRTGRGHDLSIDLRKAGEGAIVIHFIHQTLAMAAAPASGA